MIEVLSQNGTIQKMSSIDKLEIDRHKILCIHLVETNEE